MMFIVSGQADGKGLGVTSQPANDMAEALMKASSMLRIGLVNVSVTDKNNPQNIIAGDDLLKMLGTAN